MNIDLNNLKELEILDLIATQKHKTYPYISLANYSHKAAAQPKEVWEEHELLNHCRGLIYNNETGKVIAKPFKKFWNIGERNAPEIPENFMESWGAPEVSLKHDGSMGIAFKINEQIHFATRGSFASEQAIKAKQIWDEKYKDRSILLSKDITYVFEIIYPENRIVVDYGDKEDLILIGCIYTDTGEEESYAFLEVEAGDILHIPYTKSYTFTSLEKLLTNGVMDEGYVLYWPKQQVRVKAKKEWYVKVHKARFSLCEKRVWELFLQEEEGEGDYKVEPGSIDTFTAFLNLFTVLDAEDQNWLISMQAEYLDKYFYLVNKVQKIADKIEQFYNRKDQAAYIQNNLPRELWGAAFGLLDGKDITQMIKKLLKPKGLGRKPTRLVRIEEAGEG